MENELFNTKDGTLIFVLEHNGIFHIHGYKHTGGTMEVSTYQHTLYGYVNKAKQGDVDIRVTPLCYLDGYLTTIEEVVKLINEHLEKGYVRVIGNIDSSLLTINSDKFQYITLLSSLEGMEIHNFIFELIKNIRQYSANNVPLPVTLSKDIDDYWEINSILTSNPLFYAKDIYKITNGDNSFIILDYPTDDSVGTKTAEALLGHIEFNAPEDDDIVRIYNSVYKTNITRLVKFHIMNIKKPSTIRLLKLYSLFGNPIVLNKDLNENVLDSNGEEITSVVRSPGLPLARYSTTLGQYKHFLNYEDKNIAMELDITEQLFHKPGRHIQFRYKGTDDNIKLVLDKSFTSSKIELISGINCPPFKVLKKIERDIVSVSILKEFKPNGVSLWFLKLVTASYGKALFYNISNRIR